MKKYQSLSAPNAEDVWADVENLWPTGRGTYETSDIYPTSDTTITATAEGGAMISAWAFDGLTASRAYYVGKYIWELDSALGAATDRTGALGASAVAGTGGHAAQYGDITIMARGTGASLIFSSGANFAALAGSPSARFVVVQSNCVVAFNTGTNSDAWHASDVGDYTNWTTGEAANGRILENNGPITAALPYGNDIIVFKSDAIFRMTYVGGAIKWQIQKIWSGLGCENKGLGGGNPVVATNRGIFFCGGFSRSADRYLYFMFDGISPPRILNPMLTIAWGVGIPLFDSKLNMVSLFINYFGATGDNRTYIYYYSVDDDAWGKASVITNTNLSNYFLPLRGEHNTVAGYTGGAGPSRPLFRGSNATPTDFISKRIASNPSAVASSSYAQTAKVGDVKGKTNFSRLVPLLRRRTNYAAGTPACSLAMNFFTELHDTTASFTKTATEATRKRFDFNATDTFGQFKVTFTDMDVEIDDYLIKAKPAGTD